MTIGKVFSAKRVEFPKGYSFESILMVEKKKSLKRIRRETSTKSR